MYGFNNCLNWFFNSPPGPKLRHFDVKSWLKRFFKNVKTIFCFLIPQTGCWKQKVIKRNEQVIYKLETLFFNKEEEWLFNKTDYVLSVEEKLEVKEYNSYVCWGCYICTLKKSRLGKIIIASDHAEFRL